MPEMDGRQCLNEIIGLDPEAKVIVATGHSANDQKDTLLLAGAKSFVEKPYNVRGLLSKVREVLDAD